jgi:hypothetical protein
LSGRRVPDERVHHGCVYAVAEGRPVGSVPLGDAANVNRWRGQLGLEKVSEEKIKSGQSSLAVGSLSGRVYQITSTDGNKSTLAVILPKNNASWFFKFTGDTTIVTAERDSFLKMVTQTQLP